MSAATEEPPASPKAAEAGKNGHATNGDKSAGDPAVGTRFSAGEIYENVRLAAEEEMQRPAAALFWSALAAGLTIGFSFLAAAYLTTLVGERFHAAIGAVGYPLGFIFVVLARNQLFTENTLEPIIPLLHCPSRDTLRKLLSLWGIVLLGNLIGAFAFAMLAALTPMLDGELRQALMQLADHSTAGGFATVTYRAIFAGWLIALMAWLIASTRATGAQILLVWLTTAPIAAFGFRHSIAGSVEAFYVALLRAGSWGSMIGGFIVPAVLGNIVGGVLFVALINHGQVAADRAAEATNGENRQDDAKDSA